jgi:enoyl-CoA hydratase
MTNEVAVERREGILTISINRPEVRNAINRATAVAIAEAIDELDERPEHIAGVITGCRGTFSAGMDLKAYLAGEDMIIEGHGFAGICERRVRKPLIAAVEGWALAGGCEIALACDLIVAARDAQFGIPEVTRGLIAGAGGLLRLPRRLPSGIAAELALTGAPLGAEAAYRFGMVNELTEPGKALAAALLLAGRIAANSPSAVVASKRILATALDQTVAEGFAQQRDLLATILASEDAREGARAFAERRPPYWVRP